MSGDFAIISVESASGLLAFGTDEKCDPYVKLILNDRVMRTKTIQEELNPVWNERFSIKLQDGANVLQFAVWDFDRIAIDNLIGTASVDLKTVAPGNQLQTLVLEPETPNPQFHGTLNVRILIQNEKQAAAEAAARQIPKESVAKLRDRLKEYASGESEGVMDLSALMMPALPPMMGQKFPGVKSLDLSMNKFCTFPDLRSFTTLEQLDLIGNEIMVLPPEIGDLQSLNTLSIMGNMLHSLPKEIGKLKNLEKLELNNNSISELPREIGLLENLQTFLITGNPLTSLPDTWAGMRNLVTLDMSCCQLRRIPEELTHASRIMELNLSANFLEELPAGIGRMSRLIMLNLQDNKLHDLPVQIGACAGLGQVGYGINLSRNPIDDKEMIRCYQQGAEPLADYLGKRYALASMPPPPECLIPEDLGEYPVPKWYEELVQRQIATRGRRGAQKQAPAAAPVPTAPGEKKQLTAEEQQAMAKKLVALKTWATMTMKDVILPAIGRYRQFIRNAPDVRSINDAAYRLLSLHDDCEKVRAICSVPLRAPQGIPPSAPLQEQLRIYSMSVVNMFDSVLRTAHKTLDSYTVAQMANVLVIVQFINSAKRVFAS